MKQALSPRQIFVFCLTALSAPAVIVCAGLPWPWVLALGMFAAAVETGLVLLWHSSGEENLPHLIFAAWGRPLGKVLLTLTAGFCILLLWRFVPAADAAFPDDDTLPFVPLTLLAVAAWSVWHGRAAVIRAVGVLLFFVAALYITVFAFALPDADVSRLGAWQTDASLAPAAVLFLPTMGLYLTRPKQEKGKFPAFWIFLLVALPAAVSAICAAVPGSRGSFYEMAKSIEVLSVAQRLEPLVSALLTVGWFAALCLPALCVGEMADAVGLSPRAAAVGACLLSAPSVLCKRLVSDEILAVLGAVFCVIFPLLTLFVVARKKDKKTSQKSVDKQG